MDAATQAVLNDLDDKALDGYVSDSPFAAGFGDEGVDRDVSNILVVDNLPAVPEAKFDKLLQFVTKIFTDVVVSREEQAAAAAAAAAAGAAKAAPVCLVTMPKAPTGSTEGFAFIEFRSKADAEKAMKATDGWQFDNSHKLSVMRYDAFQQYRDEPDEFFPPEPVSFRAQADKYYWMLDEHSREEFCLRYSNSEKAPGPNEKEKHETEVLFAETRGPPALDYGGDKQKAANLQWSTSLVHWSPQGTFLVTMHPQGAKLWSGKGFREGLRLQHANVNDILWSPDEHYVCTWNGRPFQRGDSVQATREALIVWDVRTGERVRAFPQRRIQIGEVDFSWSADSRFLARIEVETEQSNLELIRIYEAPTFNLLDGRSVKAQGARDLQFCPKKAPLLAYWTPESGSTPTTVHVMELPSKKYVRSRPLQLVEGVEMKWHPQGEYLAVISEKITKAQKKKKESSEKGSAPAAAAAAASGGIAPVGTQTKSAPAGYIVEIFRVRAKDCPIEVLDVKERVSAFAWEPQGHRFGVLLGEGPVKFTVAVYQLPEGKGAPMQLFALEDREVNSLHWSPRGDFLVLSGLQSNQGRLEFFDVQNQKSLNVVSHDVANGISWDPSGRMVATTKTQLVTGAQLVRDTVANGYILWTFQGAKVFECAKPKLFQFLWRPRIEALLSDDESRDVAKNLKKYVARYQQQDKQRQERSALLARLRKRKARDDFRGFLAERAAEFEANRPFRIEMGIEDEEPQGVVVFEEVLEIDLGTVVSAL